jgi:hypothetical protein
MPYLSWATRFCAIADQFAVPGDLSLLHLHQGPLFEVFAALTMFEQWSGIFIAIETPLAGTASVAVRLNAYPEIVLLDPVTPNGV